MNEVGDARLGNTLKLGMVMNVAFSSAGSRLALRDKRRAEGLGGVSVR